VLGSLAADGIPVSVDSFQPDTQLFAASQGADYIRTHDISSLRDALTVLTALARQACPDLTPPNAGAT
jgi:dihydropteroate synthase